MSQPIELSVIAEPNGQPRWTELAKRVESIGARTLLVPDHPGAGPSPYVALAAAAAVTSTLRLSSYVSNAGVRHPLLLAGDVATLDIVSDGRAEVGIGAGHTPAEFEMTGRERPAPRQRIDECIRTAQAVRTLLDGETVEAASVGSMTDVDLDQPRPVQARVPLLIGGGHGTLLSWAGANADVVGLSGLGKTLPDGHSHRVRWSTADTDAQVARIAASASAAGVGTPPAEALVQFVHETDDRESAIAEIAARVESSAEDVRHAPYVLVGAVGQIVEQLQAANERWGIRRWALRAASLEQAERIITRLHG